MEQNHKKILTALVIAAITAGVLAAADHFQIGTMRSAMMMGYKEQANWNSWAAQYIQLDGSAKRTLRQKDDVTTLHIGTTTDEGGLAVTVKNANGEVIFSEENMGTSDFYLEVPEKATVQVEGAKHKGSFEVEYELQPPLPPLEASGLIFLYGEEHSSILDLDKEFAQWEKYYQKDKMRHLFVELPYYTAEFLNIWMKSPDNEILNALYNDWYGTAIHTEQVKQFYQKIKRQCPETVFHGTDVGHDYATTGARYLTYLRNNGLQESETYLLAEENVEQGKLYYTQMDEQYRADTMVQNFVREFDALGGANVMGIYGTVHFNTDVVNAQGNLSPNMIKQIKQHYGQAVHTENLSMLSHDPEVIGVDTIRVAGKDYEASYFGKVDLSTSSAEFKYREFWRLENAYEDFQDAVSTGNTFPYASFPMQVKKGEIIVVDYVKSDDSKIRQYYRASVSDWYGAPAAEEIVVSS